MTTYVLLESEETKSDSELFLKIRDNKLTK